MTSTTAPIPAPTGTTPADWDNLDGHRFRCVHGQKHTIGSRDDVTVAASALQLADGTIDNGAAVESALLFVDVPSGGISVRQARELAALLLAAVAEVDQWREECGGDAEAVTA